MAGTLEGLLEAIAGEDNAIGGLRLTRLTIPASAGAVILNVESTVGWDESGQVGIEGQLYSYTGKTLTTFTGITHTINGAVFPGTYKAHTAETQVIDRNQNFSAIDSLRRALFVDYADGEDLNALGRNLGVDRLPAVETDEIFRAIVKALAYNPRATVFGLELALDALVGAGNYEITENLIEDPNTVFITLIGDGALNEEAQGKYFPAGDADGVASSDTVLDVLAANILGVGGVRWKNENHVSDFTGGALPSAETIEEYDGDAGTQVWTFAGTAEGDVTPVAGEYTRFDDGGTTNDIDYTHLARVQPESDVLVEMVFQIPGAATLDAADVRQWGALIDDTDREIAWGIKASGADFTIGLADAADYVSGAAATLNKDQFYSVVLRKKASGEVTLEVDGSVVQTLPDTSLFDAGSTHAFKFGKFSTTVSNIIADVKSVGYFATTSTDYWNLRGNNGEAAAGAVDNRFETELPGDLMEDPGDVGRRFRVYGGTVQNAMGGYNDGEFFIESFVAASPLRAVNLEGVTKTNGLVSSNGANFQAANDPEAFEFPRDLGKKIVITGSTGNDGTYYISKIYREGSNFGVDLGSFLTPIAEKSSEIELSSTYPGVTPAVLLVESGMTWQVFPNFVSETGLNWEMSDAGKITGAAEVTLRQALPITTGGYVRVLDVFYTSVLSGQMLEDATIDNLLVSEIPLVYEYWPIYASDPLGYVRTYLDEITAAGVIPEFTGL